jgi:hypothetical protein
MSILIGQTLRNIIKISLRNKAFFDENAVTQGVSQPRVRPASAGANVEIRFAIGIRDI